MGETKEPGLGARIARELGQNVGRAPVRARKFDRREWEIQDDGQLVNTQTGEVRETLEGIEAETSLASVGADQAVELAGKSSGDSSSKWDENQDLGWGSGDQAGGFDEYSQVPKKRVYEDAGDKVKVKKPLPSWVRVAEKNVAKQPLPGAWKGAGKEKPEKAVKGRR